jgi:hypothetical protein
LLCLSQEKEGVNVLGIEPFPEERRIVAWKSQISEEPTLNNNYVHGSTFPWSAEARRRLQGSHYREMWVFSLRKESRWRLTSRGCRPRNDIPAETLAADPDARAFPSVPVPRQWKVHQAGAGMVRRRLLAPLCSRLKKMELRIWENTQVNNFREVLDQQEMWIMSRLSCSVRRRGNNLDQDYPDGCWAWTSQFIPSYLL